MRGRRLKKLFDAIDSLARPSGVTIEELGRHLDIEKRQVYRLIDTIQDDFRLVILKEKNPVTGTIRYSLEKEQFQPFSKMNVINLNLTPTEIIALYFLRPQARLYQGTDIEKCINRAFAKLNAFVPEGLVKRIEKVKTLFAPSSQFAKDYSGKEELIEQLTDAILKQCTCLIKYHSFRDDRVKHFKIDPLKFLEHHGGLYVFVRSTSFGDILVLAVERILNLTATDATFSEPDDFDPDALMKNAFGLFYDDPVTVTVRFSADQARYIEERKWAKEQETSICGDGSLILHLSTSGWYDVKRWILSFGPDAELLEPTELRDDLAASIKEMATKYGD